jgi:hypothetical protein
MIAAATILLAEIKLTVRSAQSTPATTSSG